MNVRGGGKSAQNKNIGIIKDVGVARTSVPRESTLLRKGRTALSIGGHHCIVGRSNILIISIGNGFEYELMIAINSPAHDFVGQQNSAHLRIFVLTFVYNCLLV